MFVTQVVSIPTWYIKAVNPYDQHVGHKFASLS
jgi:hypothetical protein